VQSLPQIRTQPARYGLRGHLLHPFRLSIILKKVRLLGCDTDHRIG